MLYIATWQDDVEPNSLGPVELTQRGITAMSIGPPGMSLFLADEPVPNPSTAVSAATATLGSALPWIARQIVVY